MKQNKIKRLEKQDEDSALPFIRRSQTQLLSFSPYLLCKEGPKTQKG